MKLYKAKHLSKVANFLLFYAFIYFLSLSAFAQTTGIWSIGPISGYNSSEDLVKAKQLVINETRATAFAILLQRIVVKEHLKKLTPLDNDEIALLEGSRQIVDEKFGGSNYSAHLSFEFIPKAVEKYLQDNKVSYSLSEPDTLLIIADGVNLPKGRQNNSKSNLWQEVFENQDPKYFIGNPIVLSAKVENEVLISLRTNNLAVYNMLKDIYRVDAVMVAWLDLQSKPQKLHITHNKSGTLQKITFAFSKQYSLIGREEMILLRSQIESYWRQEWFVTPKKKNTDLFSVELLIQYPSLRQFIVIQSLLNNISELSDFELLEVSTKSAIATLSYKGKQNKLIQELYKRGLKITKDTNTGVWKIQNQ